MVKRKSNMTVKEYMFARTKEFRGTSLDEILQALFYFGGKENATQWRQKRKQKMNVLPQIGWKKIG